MRIKVLGASNTESLDNGFSSFLIDDILAIDAGSLTRSLTFEAQLRLKAVLVTHPHYDHIRDIPAVAMNFFLRGGTVRICATAAVRDAIANYLLNGALYPRFFEFPARQPALHFAQVEPYQPLQIEGYTILPVPVSHPVPAVSYQVTSPDGKVALFTGDTGPGLADLWSHVSPQLLVIEVTAPSRYEQFAREAKHLTPGLLQQELTSFRDIRRYLPRVLIVHTNPAELPTIESEVAAVARSLECPITISSMGMQVVI
ncbi:MAG: MBL fold metallo-hydrolase [Chloroflexi bacterium]|nr:MBL fold metallo-hydrolase [Chloroflexota bacterium]